MALKVWIAFLSIAALSDTTQSFQTYPRVVKVNIELDDVIFIDDRAEKFAIKFKMLTEWARPANESEDALQEEFEPELYFDIEENSDSIRSFTQETIDGNVQQLRVLSSTFLCRMDFSWLPIDEQRCTVIIRSRVHDRNALVLNWIGVVEEPTNVATANFTVRSIEQSPDEGCLQSSDSTDFSCLRLSLICLRNYEPYLKLYMLPTAALSVVTWLTFFVRSSNLRGLMLALTMFATGTTTYLTYLKLPCSDCVKFLDIWTLLVCGLALLSFLEFVVVQLAFKRAVSGRKRYTINDLKPNCVDSSFRILSGLIMSFSITFYLIYMSVVINGRNHVF